jgi:hypothetical protein
MKTQKSKVLLYAVPVAMVLLGLLVYEYGYLRLQSEVAGIKEVQSMKIRTLEKYVQLIAEKPEIEKQLSSLKEGRKADESKLIQGTTFSLAAETLQDMVKDIVTRGGGTISSQRVGKPEDFGKFKLITVSVDTILPDSRSLRDILYSVETQTPYLFVKETDVRIRNYKDPRELVVKIDVSALTTAS